MNSINKQGWSKKWLTILIISTFASVIVATLATVICYLKYGLWVSAFPIFAFLTYSVSMNRYISKKNKEVVEQSKRS